MIGWAEKCVHQHKREVEGRFDYHERRLPSIAVRFRSDVRLSSLDDAVETTGEVFGDEYLDCSPDFFVVSIPKVPGDDKGNLDFGGMPWGSSSGREQCRMVLSFIQDLVSRAGLLAPGRVLDVLCFAESCLCDCFIIMELRLVLTNEWAEGEEESRMAEVRRSEGRVHEAEEDLETLFVARVPIYKMTTERASLTAGTEQAKTEHDTLAPRIRDLEVAAATPTEN